MFYVYLLKSEKDNKFYIGSTADLKKRIKEHSDGKVKSTACRRPLKLVYYETYADESIARKRELKVKGKNL